MAETTEKRFSLEDLEQQLKEGNPEVKDFNDAYKNLKKALIDLQQQVEFAKTINREKEAEFDKLHNELTGHNHTILIEQLRNMGYKLRQTQAFRDAFEKIGYRLLEKTRAGKRSEVYHSILRVFIAQEKEIPKVLTEPFKPVYSREMFKVLIFSFLGGVLGREKEPDQPE
jgi:chromosome segregation ATPase